MKVTLGIDIGTQFTYIGYINDGRFNSALNDDYVGYGISSTVAYKRIDVGHDEGGKAIYEVRYDTSDGILYGGAADQALLIPETGYRKLFANIKLAIRSGMTTITTDYVRNLNAPDLLQGYLDHCFSQYVKLPRDCEIEKIVVAYPNKTDDKHADTYRQVLHDKIKAVRGIEIDIAINSEAAMVADLIAKLYFAQKTQTRDKDYKDIMVIDIGAGTSDIGIAHWNGNNNKYEIESCYQESVDFGGCIIDDILTNTQAWFFSENKRDMLSKPLVDPKAKPETLIVYKKWIYEERNNEVFLDIPKTECQSMICQAQAFKEGMRRLEEGIKKCYNSYREKYETSFLEIVVLGNTSTIPPVADMIDKVFKDDNNCTVHFLDNEGDPLSDALREKGVTNSNFMAFACAFVGGGFDTDNHGLVSEAEKKEDSGREGDGIGENTKMVVIPTIHGAGADSIFAIQVLHNHKYPHFKAWDLISSPLAHEGKQYFLVGPYVDSLENSSKTQFTPVIVNRLKLIDNAPILYAEDDNPNRNFLITEFTDKYNIPKRIDGKDYYTYEKNCKANESCLSGIEIVGRGHSCDETFKVDKGCYVGVIYDYNPATPVDKKLQIYYWEKTNAAYKGGVCYYDEDNQKAIDFETFRNEAKKDGRCNLYD